VSKSNTSVGESKARCKAIVSSTTPRFGPRWPPVRVTFVDQELPDLGGKGAHLSGTEAGERRRFIDFSSIDAIVGTVQFVAWWPNSLRRR
jgi:hypothetical protein